MRKKASFLVFSAFFFFTYGINTYGINTYGINTYSISAIAQGSTAEEIRKMLIRGDSQTAPSPNFSGSSSAAQAQLSSPSVSQKFYEIAYELTNSTNVGGPDIEAAIVFLTAAMELDPNVKDIQALLIKLACRRGQRTEILSSDNLVYNLLMDYVDESADIEVAKQAFGYLLAQLDTREQREKLLEQMLPSLGSKNVVFGSELATLLGILKAEKADLDSAEFYLIQAYKNNRYNKSAFAKLAEVAPERIGPAIYLERLRLELRENPTDINAAFVFAQQAEKLQLYETATAAYEYCADLFTYLYPSAPLSARVYLPWAISAYNTQSNQSKCLDIVRRIRRTGRFDLRIEAVAGRAATKMGNGELATQLFQAAEKKAKSSLLDVKQLAWFYCFVLPAPGKALNFANEAYAAEPNSPEAGAILAYALVMNNQTEWAKPIINNFERNQIADLTQAQIHIADGQTNLAIETLKTAIAQDPGSFAAERAKEIVAQLGGKYTPPVDPVAVLTELENVLGSSRGGFIAVFTPPEKIISAQFNVRRYEFPYGEQFNGTVAIINNSSEPLVISDDALFKGNIRIDADITGDLNRKIPELVCRKVRTALLIEPGRSILVPVQLITGELREMLFTYPQASLDIEFTLYLDPVTTDKGKVTNRLAYIQPTRVRIKRPGVELSDRYLRDRFNSISKGNIGQQIKTAQLFTSLLKEQYAMGPRKAGTLSNRKPLYSLMYADGMESLLRSALIHESGLLCNPAKGRWVVNVHTMAEMVSLPLDYELLGAVAKNLGNTNWAVRMMAVYLLSSGGQLTMKTEDSNFDKVLDWTANNDSNKFVRDMAIAVLGGSVSGRRKQP